MSDNHSRINLFTYSSLKPSLILLGAIILFYIVFPTRFKLQIEEIQLLKPFFRWIRQTLSTLFKEKSFSSLFFMGALNGFLPCGLVYAALAGALATGTPIKGSLFMMFFGLGTFPLMVFANLSGNLISIQWRNRIRKAVPVLVATMAVFLITRGLNLGIPYISPKIFDLNIADSNVCH